MSLNRLIEIANKEIGYECFKRTIGIFDRVNYGRYSRHGALIMAYRRKDLIHVLCHVSKDKAYGLYQ